MRNLLDELGLRTEYIVESVRLRAALDRDDPLVDHRRRAWWIGGIIGLLLGGAGLLYIVHQVDSSPAPAQPAAQAVEQPRDAAPIASDTPVEASPSSPRHAPSSSGAQETVLSSTAAPSSRSCNSNYSPCVPNVAYDLDCPDIGFRVQVTGSDVYRLDRDGDGVGCEAY